MQNDFCTTGQNRPETGPDLYPGRNPGNKVMALKSLDFIGFSILLAQNNLAWCQKGVGTKKVHILPFYRAGPRSLTQIWPEMAFWAQFYLILM